MPHTPTSARFSKASNEVFVPGVLEQAEGCVGVKQDAYVEQRDLLATALQRTQGIARDVKEFNKESWTIRYPQLAPSSDPVPDRRPGVARRSLSFADQPSSATEVTISTAADTHSITMSSLSEVPEEADKSEEEESASKDEATPTSDFQVIRLDLNLGPNGSAAVGSLVSQLEKESIAKLLEDRFSGAIKHMDNLLTRIHDTASKVLVTGDLNAGKSTFVNALLSREVLPVDQQPCTTMFCEVHDAAENGGVEEVHLMTEGMTYSRDDESTFTRAALADLEKIVTESDAQHILKVYVSDARASTESLLKNGVVDITLIDAPGLNRDSVKTTALFARQEEIDVVVFVVDSLNHLTESGISFLKSASTEKAYLFIVANRFDLLRDPARCKRRVLEQIQKLSPHTFGDAENLVHFVDSASALERGTGSESVKPDPLAPAFDKLEVDLRSFVLMKRTLSKLMPAATYLTKFLSDVELLAGANSILAQGELEEAKSDLDREKPVLEAMKRGKDGLEANLELTEESRVSESLARAMERIELAIERVGMGQVGVEEEEMSVSSRPRRAPALPPYPGLLSVWEYAKDVKQALYRSVDLAVHLAEDESRSLTSASVNEINQLGESHLPAGVERSRRVFLPEAMFSARRRGRRGRGNSTSIIVAGGTHNLGIGLAQNPELRDVSFSDIIGVQYYLDNLHDENDEDDKVASTFNIVSLGVGALTMIGGKAVGARGLLEGIMRVFNIFGDEESRKWVAPVVGVATVGLSVYLVWDLPNAIPRTIGRNIRASLVESRSAGQSRAESSLTRAPPDESFAAAHAHRISRETRKVLRIAAWDVKERFRVAMEERSRDVKVAEERMSCAEKAREFFGGIVRETRDIREKARLAANSSRPESVSALPADKKSSLSQDKKL